MGGLLGASGGAYDDLIYVHFGRLLDRVSHGTRNGVGRERDLAEVDHGIAGSGVGYRVGQFRLDDAWRDDRDTDVLGLQAQALGDGEDGGLRAAVNGAGWPDLMATDRREVDDVPDFRARMWGRTAAMP
jgi:hypothetical protein